MGNNADLIQCLLGPQSPDLKNKNKTSNCNSDENDQDDSRIGFDGRDTDSNSDEN